MIYLPINKRREKMALEKIRETLRKGISVFIKKTDINDIATILNNPRLENFEKIDLINALVSHTGVLASSTQVSPKGNWRKFSQFLLPTGIHLWEKDKKQEDPS